MMAFTKLAHFGRGSSAPKSLVMKTRFTISRISLVVVEVSSDQKLGSLAFNLRGRDFHEKKKGSHRRDGRYMIALNDTPEPVSPEK